MRSTSSPGPGVVVVTPADRRIGFVSLVAAAFFISVIYFTWNQSSGYRWVLLVPLLVFLLIAYFTFQESNYYTTADCDSIEFFWQGNQLWSVPISSIDESSCCYSAFNRWLTFRTVDGKELRWLVPTLSHGPESTYIRYQIIGEQYAKEVLPAAREYISVVYMRVCEDPSIGLEVEKQYRLVRDFDNWRNSELFFYTTACGSLIIRSIEMRFGHDTWLAYAVSAFLFSVALTLTLLRWRYLDRDSDLIKWTGRDLVIERIIGKRLVIPNVSFEPPQSATRAYQEFQLNGRIYRLDRAVLVPVESADN